MTETDEGRGISLGVPPRPAEGLFAEFRGSGMDGATRDKILSGEMAVPDNLKPSQWDELFGEDYNKDGSPKVTAEPEKTVDTTETIRYNESNPLDLKSMSEDEAIKAYENLKKASILLILLTVGYFLSVRGLNMGNTIDFSQRGSTGNTIDFSTRSTDTALVEKPQAPVHRTV